MKGLHLTADLYRCRCDAAWLCDARKLQESGALRATDDALRA